MRYCIPLRLLCFTSMLAFVLPAGAVAQSQEPSAQSVVEAARRAREKTKSEKPVPVVTDDTLKRTDSAAPEVSVVGTSPSAPSSEATPGQTAAPAEKKSAEAAKADLDAAKARLDAAKQELDLAQREAALEQQTYFSNPNYQDDSAGKAKVDALQQDAAAKQQVVDKLQAELDELQKSTGGQSNPAENTQAPASSPSQPQP